MLLTQNIYFYIYMYTVDGEKQRFYSVIMNCFVISLNPLMLVTHYELKSMIVLIRNQNFQAVQNKKQYKWSVKQNGTLPQSQLLTYKSKLGDAQLEVRGHTAIIQFLLVVCNNTHICMNLLLYFHSRPSQICFDFESNLTTHALQ